MRIIMFYEHKVRELPALRKLRDELRTREHVVSIYSIAFEWYDAYLDAKKNGVDVLLVPWCYSAEQFWRFSPFYELNPVLRMVNLHHEQITPKLTECVLMPRDRTACDYPYHFCWTTHFKELLINTEVAEDKIFVVGNLRLEPVDQNRKIRQMIAERYHLDQKKKWILYAESRRIDDISIDKIRYDFHEMAGVSDDDCDRYFARWKDSLERTITQIKALPDSFFEKYELIYRPHPGSTIEFNLGKNARVISENPISDWLNSVDAYCTWQSTSAFEAEMYGLPVLFHEAITIPIEEQMPGVSDYYKVSNLSDIDEEMLSRCVLLQRENPIFEKYIGYYSADTVKTYADVIESLASKNVLLPVVPYSQYWLVKMWLSERVIKVMKRFGLIRKLHWPHTASMMYEDIPFGDERCRDLHS